MPVPICVAKPVARKVVVELSYLFRFSCAACAGEGPFALLGAGGLFRHHAVVPVVLGLVHLLGAVFVRGAGVPVIIFVVAPLFRRNVRVVIQNFFLGGLTNRTFVRNFAVFGFGGRGPVRLRPLMLGLIICCVATRALVPMIIFVAGPFFRKVVAEPVYLFRFGCAAFAGEGLYAVLRAGGFFRHHAVVPVVWSDGFVAAFAICAVVSFVNFIEHRLVRRLVELFRAVEMRRARLPMRAFVVAPLL